ncbi:MAG: hypothetical protein HY744_29855, partial [Deltaproteobacteria bacterium]|nr:hypothetical protein [Deltaproteobacteria bacterium]
PAPRLERPAPPAPASLPAAPPRDLGATERQAVELVWFAQGRLAALRRHWGELLGPEPGGAEGRAEAELTGARRDAFAVLTVPPPGGLDSLGDAIRAAVSVYERFEPPGLVLVGQIVLPFDELQTLRAAAAVLSALGATDRRVKELVGPLAELAQEPMLEGCSQAVEALLEPLRERYAQARRGAPQDSLQDHVERILLRQRAYQRRSVFGPTSIRALLVSLDGQLAVPTYLPEDAAPRLPLMTSFPARLVAELHPRQDQLEACPYALRALVLGRIFSV